MEQQNKNGGQDFSKYLLEQYKMYVEMMDRVSERRAKANSFYISLLSGIFALVSLLLKILPESKSELSLGLIVLSFLGVILSLVWFFTINSYKQLNSLKFQVIGEMEQHLPFPCYEREWQIDKERKSRYIRLTFVEKLVPLTFVVFYLLLLIYSFSPIISKSPTTNSPVSPAQNSSRCKFFFCHQLSSTRNLHLEKKCPQQSQIL